MTKPRIVFAGTPAFAAAHLQALLHANSNIVAVYSQPDRPAKRGQKPTASDVKTLALACGLPVYQPLTFNDHTAINTLVALQPDILAVVAYGLILPQAVLKLPAITAINVHASLLPRWRGAAPIERAIEAGDTETGITIMAMEAKLDSGPILLQTRCSISPTTTGDELHRQLAALGPPLLLQAIDDLAAGRLTARPQSDSGISYAPKLQKQECAINWQQPVAALVNKVRAFNSRNVAAFTVGNKRIRLWCCKAGAATVKHRAGEITRHADNGIHVQAGDGEIVLQQLQLPGGRVQTSRELLNGHAAAFALGTVLS